MYRQHRYRFRSSRLPNTRRQVHLGKRARLSRRRWAVLSTSRHDQRRMHMSTSAIPCRQQEGPEQPKTSAPLEEGKVMTAPMVGTLHKPTSPEADSYVKVGDKVDNTSVVCIPEAMILFNEIQAEISGEITEILVEDGDMVEYDQPLFRVR